MGGYWSANRAQDNRVSAMVRRHFFNTAIKHNQEDIKLYDYFYREMPRLRARQPERYDWFNYYLERAYARIVVGTAAKILPSKSFWDGAP